LAHPKRLEHFSSVLETEILPHK